MKTEPKTETAVAVPEASGVPAELAGQWDLKENMATIEPRLPRINVLHQAQMFKFPDRKESSFVGTILDISRINAWWEQSFDESGGNTPPQCASMDGITPASNCEAPQSTTCATCPQNTFGSDGKRGKACKNMKRVHIMVPGSMFPHRLTLPPSNLRPVDEYVSMLTGKNLPYQLVQTEFSLAGQKNKDGIQYSEIILRTVGYINDPAEARAMREAYKGFRNVMRGVLPESAKEL